MSLKLNNMKFDISYKSELGAPEINALKNLNIRRSKSTRSALKNILLISSLFLCSVALATCQASEAISWIALLLSITSIIVAFSINKFFRAFYTALLKKDTEPKEYHFGKDGIAISSKTETIFTEWNAVSEQGKIYNFTYLILNNQEVILIDNNKMLKDELESLQTLLKEKTSDKDSDIANNNHKQTAIKTKVLSYVVASIVALGIVYCLIILCYPLSDQELFRLWLCRDTHLVLSTLLGVTTLTWFLITVKQIKINFEKSFLKRCIAWIAMILVIIALGLGMLINLVKNDRTEYPNDDKTITIEQPVWLDKTQYSLYQKSGIFTLKYLRNTEGFSDTDTTISQDEYLENKSSKPIDNEAYKKTIIDKGYRKVTDTFLDKEHDIYKQEYDAKGNSYIVLYDSATEIRYLQYDSNNSDDFNPQFVYFKNSKNKDGSWSPSESEILGMYKYDSHAEEAYNLDKTSW